MSRSIGYLRHATSGRDLQLQLDHLKAAGATEILHEVLSKAKRNAPHLDKLMLDLKDGDTLVITSLDQITYNTKHLLKIVNLLNAAGASLRVIDSEIDTSPPDGEIVRRVIAAVSDFERRIVRERQAEGIARAKQEGRYTGRKPTAMAKTNEALMLKAQGLTRQRIADQLGIGVASVYRIFKSQSTSLRKISKASQNPVKKQKRVICTAVVSGQKGEQLSLF